MPGLGSAGTPMDGVAAKGNHAKYESTTRAILKQCSEYGAPNILAMTGPPLGITYAEAADNTVEFMNKVKSQAEDGNVTICMEILNAIDHPNYAFDHAEWGFDVCRRVNSPRVKVLYDIYHSQIQDGDIVRTIRENIDWIGHIHTAGNPGRRQLDDEQELNYPFIAREIAKLKFTGYVGHEYMPQPDTHALEDLKKAYDTFDLAIC
jgi:hydroxypyruvate isomerase